MTMRVKIWVRHGEEEPAGGRAKRKGRRRRRGEITKGK
jgi:hypothetical protein